MTMPGGARVWRLCVYCSQRPGTGGPETEETSSDHRTEEAPWRQLQNTCRPMVVMTGRERIHWLVAVLGL